MGSSSTGPRPPLADDGQERGLHFICLNADLVRQFEFVQATWAASPKFGGLYDDADPLIGSRGLFERAQKNTLFVNALEVIAQGRVMPVPGGVLMQDGGVLLGAVGVSGDASDNDEACAVAGIEAAGLKANAG